MQTGSRAVIESPAAIDIGSGASRYTGVAALEATSTTSGNVATRGATALRLLGGTLASTGASLAVQTVDGDIVVDGLVNSSGTVGNVLLQSAELLEATGANFDVRANVGSSAGNIGLVAADSILIDDQAGAAPLIETRATGKTVDLAADGAVTMEALARLLTPNGNIKVTALVGDIALGVASAGTGAISVRATATAYAAQSDLVATGAGNIVVQATDLTASDDVSAAAGKILLSASTGALTVNNSVTSTSGAISLMVVSIVDHNGSKIPLLRTMEESEFNKRLSSVKPADLAAQTPGERVFIGKTVVPVEQFVSSLPGAALVSAGAGRYNVRAGMGLVTNSASKRITIEVSHGN